MPNQRRLIRFDDTRFIFQTNFEGNPDNDRYGSRERKGNIIIPDENLAHELKDSGFNVKETRPRPGYEDEFVPEYFVPIKINFNPPRGVTPPVVKLVTDTGRQIQLDESMIKVIDDLQSQRLIKNVNVVCNARYNDDGRNTLYISVMYVEQDMEMDPYASRYSHGPDADVDVDEDLPF